MSTEKYNQEVEDYNNAVDNENSLSDDIMAEMAGMRLQLKRIADLLEKWSAKQPK